MAQEIDVKIKVDTSQAVGALNKLSTGVEETTKKSNTLKETLSGSKSSEFINSLGDGVYKLNPAFGTAIKGANGLILKMWEMVANPVGAIIAALVVSVKFLYEAFQSSVAGGKELKTIFAGISAVGEQVKDAIFGLGRALINVTTAAYKFITLDFAGAAEDMKKANKEASNSYEQLGNAVDGTTFKIVKNLEAQQQANDKARKIQAVVQSETNKLLVQSREILTDETASIKDKKKALEEVTKAEKESSAEKVRIAKVDLDILKAKASALGGEAEKKMKGEIREATIALNEAETENAMTGIKLNKQRKMLGRQEVADAKEAADAKKAIADEQATKDKEIYEADKTALTERLKTEKLTFEERRKIVADDHLLNKKDRQKFNDEINRDEAKSIEEHNKAIADLNKRYDDAKANREANTAVKKEELDYQRKTAEIEALVKTEEEKKILQAKLDEEHLINKAAAVETDNKTINDLKQKYIDEQAQKDADTEVEKEELDYQKRLAEIAKIEGHEIEKAALIEKLKKDHDKRIYDATKKDADAQIALEEAKKKAKIKFAKDTADSLAVITTALLGQSKAGIAVQKALALTQIGIDTASAFSSAVKEAKKASAAAPPGFGPVASVISYASSAAMIVSNMQKAKSILSSGGSGGGGSTPSTPPTPAAIPTMPMPTSAIETPTALTPSANVLQSSGINQLASTLGGQAPIKAYVVGKDVSTQQSLDRNIVNTATLG
jgi:hypothetical protein